MQPKALWPNGLGRGRLLVSPSSAIVRVEAPRIAPRLELAGRAFLAKREFHVTLLGREGSRRLAEAAGGSAQAARLVRKAWRGAAVRIEPGDELWMLDEPPAASIVLECRLQGGETFFETLSACGVVLEPPPFHVTLYLSGAGKGIGVHSAGELERLGRRLASHEREVFLLAARGGGTLPDP